MAGMTKTQYQEENTRRLAARRNCLAKKVQILLGRVERLDATFSDQVVLTFDQHRELENLRDRLTTHLSLLDPKSIFHPPSETQLAMSEESVVALETRLAKLEQESSKTGSGE